MVEVNSPTPVVLWVPKDVANEFSTLEKTGFVQLSRSAKDYLRRGIEAAGDRPIELHIYDPGETDVESSGALAELVALSADGRFDVGEEEWNRLSELHPGIRDSGERRRPMTKRVLLDLAKIMKEARESPHESRE
ncbi:MAG: hypothetical protein LC723_01715 [Actinobacteria bacterium]|nr:hypothetical protein [Actinomycetota bacterium]